MSDPRHLSRRACLGLGASAALSLAMRPALAAQATSVVELFTSQGCSSCPPADEFAGELRQRPGVAVLTYHVDYWDYLGWKDTLGAPEFSQRQYDYAKARGDMDVYTPQMIVNGASHFVGSKRNDVLAALDRGSQPSWAADVSIGLDGKDVVVRVGEADFKGEATVWYIPVRASITVSIERGEIAGRAIDYHNVVRRIAPVGKWMGKPASFTFLASTVVAPDCTGCVALLQENKAGAVLGVGIVGDVMS